MLGLGGDAELPELVVKLLHEGVDRGTDGAKVVLLELLALGGSRAKERAAGQPQVLALLVVLLLDEEELLLGAEGGVHRLVGVPKERHHLAGHVGDGLHRAQQRDLLVQRLAGVAAEGGGDAEDLVLDEGVAGGVPGGVAAGLKGGADAARGEARGIRLALDQFLAREGLDGAAVLAGHHEAVVLLGGDAGQWLEPVGVVGGAVLDGPLLHAVSHDVGDVDVEWLVVLGGLLQLLVGLAGDALTHCAVVKDQLAVDLGDLAHARVLSGGRALGPSLAFATGVYASAQLFRPF